MHGEKQQCTKLLIALEEQTKIDTFDIAFKSIEISKTKNYK